MRYVLIIITASMLSACAPQPVYKWGNYESDLYSGYKDPTKMQALKLDLERHIAEMDKSGQKVAPGLFAELGTLYLQSGASDKAVVMYKRERDTWPESKGLMTAMITNIERRQQAHQEAAK